MLNYDANKLDMLKDELYKNAINYTEYSVDTIEINTKIDNLNIYVTVNGIYQMQICEATNTEYGYNFNLNVFFVDKVVEYIKRAFNNVPSNYEKYIEEYTSFKGKKGVKYIVINDTKLVKREIILIPLEDN